MKIKWIIFSLSMLVVYPLMGQESAISSDKSTFYSLDGNWELTGYNPDKSKFIKLEASVPGQVHQDLLKAGLISDPFWRDNAEQCQWPEHWEWRYKKTFNLPADFLQHKLILQFDGLDTYAEIYINGRKLGNTEDMFLPYEFDVSGDWLMPQNNVLEVRFLPIESMAGDKAKLKLYSGAFGDYMRPYVRRMQCTFGWDWVTRFITAGIWKSCRIASYPVARVEDVFAYTKTLTADEAVMELAVKTIDYQKSDLRLKLQLLDPKGKIAWEQTSAVNNPEMKFDVSVHHPQLWWPNGAGEHPLYQVTAILMNKAGEELHRYTVETGIRTVTIEELPDADKHGKSFTLIVNGKKIFAKGGNWIPADPFPARISGEKYDLLIRQAHDAGMNMLRSWGGGIYEADAFWHACNRMGIMVSQDFLLACARYPEDDQDFRTLLTKEFTANIKRLRNNPSLVFWCGDNELGLGRKPSDNWSCKRLQQTLTAPLLAKMDPSRKFTPTSPYGEDSLTTNSSKYGDCHLSGYMNDDVRFGDLKDYRKIIAVNSTGRFTSESSTAGSPSKRSLLKFMNEEDLSTNEMFEFHTKDNPYSRGGLTLFRFLQKSASALYGVAQNTDRRISQLEYTQYDFVRLSMECSRLHKFYSSGILFWMYNDCWPAVGWSLVDYWGNRKAGWYAFASASQPVIAACDPGDKTIKWWICNDEFKDVKVKVKVSVQPVEGEPRWSKQLDVVVPANSSKVALEVPVDQMKEKLGNDAVLVCEAGYAGGYDRSYWTSGLPKEVQYPENKLMVSQKGNGYEGEVTVKTDKWARVVSLDADVDFEDNYFDMLPGETRTIKWKSRGVKITEPIKVTSWNQ